MYTFRKGLIDGLPIAIGYLSVSFAFGIFAVSAGLQVPEALLISMANVTSAGQLAAVPIITGGGMLTELAISQFVINLRYALMSISLSQRFDNTIRLLDRFVIAFVNTDEVFAVASTQRYAVGKRYMYGLILTPWLGWSAGTLLGAIAGDVLPAIITSALGVAIYGMFIAIIVPAARGSRAIAICAILASILSCAFRYLPPLQSVPSGFVIIVCAVVAAGVMSILSPISASQEVENDG